MSNLLRKCYMIFEFYAITMPVPVIVLTFHYVGIGIICTMLAFAIAIKRMNMHFRKFEGKWCPDMRWWWNERKIQNYYAAYKLMIKLAENNCRNRANDMPWNIYEFKDPLSIF